MGPDLLPGPFVVRSVAEDELHLVMGPQVLEVLHPISMDLAGSRGLQIEDADHPGVTGTDVDASLANEVLVQRVVGNVEGWEFHQQVVEAFFRAVFVAAFVHRCCHAGLPLGDGRLLQDVLQFFHLAFHSSVAREAQ